MKRFTIALFLSLLMPAICLGQQSLVGTYKLLSFTYQIDDGPVQQRYEQAPTGYIIVTPKRFMSVIAAGGRKAGQSAADKAALLDSLVAYTGPYRVEGNSLITQVDVSWIEAWTGKDQGRIFKIEGSRLTINTMRAPLSVDPSKTTTAQLVFEKVE